MQPVSRLVIAGLMLAVGATAVPGVPTAWADPPGDRGHGHDRDDEHGRGHDRAEHRERAEHADRWEEHRGHFQDHDRVVVHSYFVDYYEHGGHCPPGLAKKGNGCYPPGHRPWVVGTPLPAEVVTYELPPQLVVQLTPPPIGYRYVRVASDILLVAAGTGMVAAAIEDLAR